jgi:hypothetical protein
MYVYTSKSHFCVHTPCDIVIHFCWVYISRPCTFTLALFFRAKVHSFFRNLRVKNLRLSEVAGCVLYILLSGAGKPLKKRASRRIPHDCFASLCKLSNDTKIDVVASLSLSLSLFGMSASDLIPVIICSDQRPNRHVLIQILVTARSLASSVKFYLLNLLMNLLCNPQQLPSMKSRSPAAMGAWASCSVYVRLTNLAPQKYVVAPDISLGQLYWPSNISNREAAV